MLHIPSNLHKTTQWSGGTTTELFIYPPGSDYGKRNFQFRISSATIDVDESVFTKLPGISRKLMILNGSVDIIHRDKYAKRLGKFEKDVFSGDWDTMSIGRATDFNLMTSGKVTGDIVHFELMQNGKLPAVVSHAEMVVLYIFTGSVLIEGKAIESGDIVIFDSNDDYIGSEISTTSTADIILVSLWGFAD